MCEGGLERDPDRNVKDCDINLKLNILQIAINIKFFYNKMFQSTPNQSSCQYANEYKLHFLLGEGGQASVYLGSKGNQIYAIKIYAKGINKEQGFKREVDFLAKLKFKYLISIVDSCSNADVKLKHSKLEKRAIIVLQFAEAELFDFISKEGRFAPDICRTLIKQLIDAIKFLDEQGITHRDLKPQNILFDKNFNFKVSDFGMSTFTQGHSKNGKLYTTVGTTGYKPPEMQEGNYTGLQADLFAAGVILFVMYCGTPPFLNTKLHDKIYRLIRERNYSKFWAMHEKNKPSGFFPDSFKRLLNEFFTADISKRPTLETLAQDEWLNGDIAMGEELKDYMQKRYDKIAEEDEVKNKVAEIRKEMFVHQKMQSECSTSTEGESQNLRSSEVKLFTQRSQKFNNIKLESLPETEKKITYFSKDLGFVLAFLNDYIDECPENKSICMPEFLQKIEPCNFVMQFDGEEVELKFVFEIDGDDEETLKLKGKLYQKQGKYVGIEWVKVMGNDFWLNSIIADLNKRLQVLC